VRQLVLGVGEPTSASASCVRRFRSARVSLAPNTRSTARCTLSKHDSHGSSEWFWNTTPRSGPGPAISRPAHSITPDVGFSRPATRLSSVVLPQPEWPISVMNSPRSTDRSMSRSATKGPFFVLNVIATLSTWTNSVVPTGSAVCGRAKLE
jgi:hypothetical protein